MGADIQLTAVLIYVLRKNRTGLRRYVGALGRGLLCSGLILATTERILSSTYLFYTPLVQVSATKNSNCSNARGVLIRRRAVELVRSPSSIRRRMQHSPYINFPATCSLVSVLDMAFVSPNVVSTGCVLNAVESLGLVLPDHDDIHLVFDRADHV